MGFAANVRGGGAVSVGDPWAVAAGACGMRWRSVGRGRGPVGDPWAVAAGACGMRGRSVGRGPRWRAWCGIPGPWRRTNKNRRACALL